MGLCSLHLWVSVSMFSLKIATSWCWLFVYVMWLALTLPVTLSVPHWVHLCVINWETEKIMYFFFKANNFALTKPNRLNLTGLKLVFLCAGISWWRAGTLLFPWFFDAVIRICCVAGRQNEHARKKNLLSDLIIVETHGHHERKHGFQCSQILGL